MSNQAELREAALDLCRELQCPAMEYMNPAVQDAWSKLYKIAEQESSEQEQLRRGQW